MDAGSKCLSSSLSSGGGVEHGPPGSVVAKLWHPFVDGFHDDPRKLAGELAVFHHLAGGVQGQAEQGGRGEFQPGKKENPISSLFFILT